jgi:hypothetical protein
MRLLSSAWMRFAAIESLTWLSLLRCLKDFRLLVVEPYQPPLLRMRLGGFAANECRLFAGK